MQESKQDLHFKITTSRPAAPPFTTAAPVGAAPGLYSGLVAHQTDPQSPQSDEQRFFREWAHRLIHELDLRTKDAELLGVPLIKIERLRNLKTLGRYEPRPDGYNIAGTIALNEERLPDLKPFHKVVLMMKLLLEAWQHRRGVRPGSDEQALRAESRRLGLIIARKGLITLHADGKFRRVLEEHGVELPRDDAYLDFDLRLLPSADDEAVRPATGSSLVVVAAAEQSLHFRIFDADARLLVDKDEKGLFERRQPIKELRKRLGPLWPPHELSARERRQIIEAVTLIVDPLRWFPQPAREAKSTLTPWSCGCQTVFVGRGEHLSRCTHPECGQEFVRGRHVGRRPAEYSLRLLPALRDEAELPAAGRNLVDVAAVAGVLRFRIFDRDARRVVDTDETSLIAGLRKQLDGLWPPDDSVAGAGLRVVSAPPSFLRLLPSEPDEVVTTAAGNDLVVVTSGEGAPRFGILHGPWRKVMRTDEAALFRDFRERLDTLWPPHELTEAETAWVINSVRSMVESAGLGPSARDTRRAGT